jgi:hypothetical protein
LTFGRLGEQVFVLAEQDALKFCGTIQQLWIFQFRRLGNLGGSQAWHSAQNPDIAGEIRRGCPSKG